MKEKLIYQAPDLEQVEVRTEANFLTSAESMSKTSVDGSWDDPE